MALDYKIMGERLKKARKDKNLTQEALAEKLDVSPAFINRIENANYKINLTRLEQICDLLDTDISYILKGVSNKSNDYLRDDFSILLKSCPPEKIDLIYKVAKTIVEG